MINITEKEIMEKWKGDITKPLVSVCSLVYNHERFIEDSLDGILSQETTFPFEIIVHDDASTDNTVEIIKKYHTNYPNIIKPIYEKENQYSKKINIFTRIINSFAKGKYISLCEGDDYWFNNSKLQKQVEALENNKNCSIAYCIVDFVDVNGNKIGISAPPKKCFRKNIITINDFLKVEFGKCYWCFHTSSFVCRKSLYEEYVNIRKKEFSLFPYGDLPLQLWYLLNGDGYLILEEMSCYRQNTGGYNSVIKKNPEKHISEELSLIKALESFDIYTKGKYRKYIKSRIRKAHLIIMTIGKTEREYLKETLKPINWKTVGIRELTINCLKLYFPHLFNMFYNFKGKFSRYR